MTRIPIQFQLSRVLSCLILLAVLGGCKQEETPKEIVTQPTKDSIPVPPPKVADTLRFTAVAISGFSDLKDLDDKLSDEEMLLVLKLNRLDRAHIRDNDTLAVPTSFDERLIPFPVRVEVASEIPKLILVSRRAQAFAAHDSGMLVRWGPTSTGKKKTPTPDGLYSANWKKDTAISTIDDSWILPRCVNIHNFEGISFHQFDLPGYPASHSCIRLLAEDAAWIFAFVDTWRLTKDASRVLAHGTPVIIFDEYPFGTPFLRKKILRDYTQHYVPPATVDSVIRHHKMQIAERQSTRKQVLEPDSSVALSNNP